MTTCDSASSQILSLEKHVISKDLQSTSILVFLESFEHKKALSQGRFVTQRVHEIIDPLRQHAEVFIGGLPEMEFEGTTNMISDLKLFTPLTLILVVGLLIVSFRSWRGISLPLVAVLIALLWTLGPMALIGRPLTITTLTLPSLLIANGSSYVIHFLTQYYRALLRAYRREGSTYKPGDKRLLPQRPRINHSSCAIGQAELSGGITRNTQLYPCRHSHLCRHYHGWIWVTGHQSHPDHSGFRDFCDLGSISGLFPLHDACAVASVASSNTTA